MKAIWGGPENSVFLSLEFTQSVRLFPCWWAAPLLLMQLSISINNISAVSNSISGYSSYGDEEKAKTVEPTIVTAAKGGTDALTAFGTCSLARKRQKIITMI